MFYVVLHHGHKSWIVVVGGDGNKGFQYKSLPYKLGDINQAMVTSPDGMGIVIVGGYNEDSESSEKRILESRFDGSQFLPWQVIDQELYYGRRGHVVIPISKSITNCN